MAAVVVPITDGTEDWSWADGPERSRRGSGRCGEDGLARPALALVPRAGGDGDVSAGGRAAAKLVPPPVVAARRRRARRRVVARRRRMVAAGATSLVAMLVVGMALAAGAGAPGRGPLTATGSPVAASARPAAARVWIVRPGDTLWGIVEASGVRGDPRPIVDRLSAQRGGRPLQAGEEIVVP